MKTQITKNSFLAVLILVFALSSIFTACSSGSNTEDNSTVTSTPGDTATKLEGTISVIGSTSVSPLAQDLADVFNETNTEVKIDVQALGSSEGVKAVHEGTATIGISSRDLKDDEKTWGLTEHKIALDAIAVVVHPDNSLSDLTKEQIQKIFKGEITNWKEVGGVDKEIIVVSRESGSGTRGAFEELLGLEKKNDDGTKTSLVIENALIAESNGTVKSNIASKGDSIGYMSLGVIDQTVKALKIDGVEATVENVKSKTYSVWRPFYMLTKGEIKEPVKTFLDFIMSDEGQEIVAEKYIKVD